MLLVLHTPGLEPGYMRACMFALGEPHVFVDYEPGGDLRAWVDQAERLRMELAIPCWRVLGHGLGGVIAQAYAAAHPDRVERLLLCSTAPRLGPRFRRLLHTIEATVPGDAQFRRWCMDVLPAAFGEMPLGDDTQRLFSTMHFARRPFLRALGIAPRPFGGISTKTLILHGRLDRLVWLAEGGELLLDELPDAELIVFERSGHFPFIEQSRPFLETVDEFLRQESAAVSPSEMLPA